MEGENKKRKIFGYYVGIHGIAGWAIAGVIALGLSSLFVLIYNYSGTHIINPSGATDYKWHANQYKAQWAEGINYMRMDDNGFHNLSSDVSRIDILLMGGSHMEAIQFGTEYNVGSLLNNYLPEFRTYNIGMSGHQFVNCLDNLEAAIEEYKPLSYVVLETDNINADLDSIKAVQNGTLMDIPSYDSGILYQLQRIPVLKVIYKQLTEKLNVDKAIGTKMESHALDVKTVEDSDAMLDKGDDKLQVISAVLDEKTKFCKEHGVRLVLAYTPWITIESNGAISRNDDEEWVNSVENAAVDSGIIMVDCYEAMKQEYERSCELPFGFNNATMGSGHLNKAGHRIVAQEIYNVIARIEEKGR